MTETINPFTGQTFVIASDLVEPLIIENFDPTKDVIQLVNNTEQTTIPHLSFGDEYSLVVSDGDTFIKNLYGKIVAIVKDTTDLNLFTGYTPKGTFTLLSLDNEFFSETLAPTFFEPWYVEFDESDYGNSVQEAIDAGLVDSAYEHYIKFGQYEAREDSIFAAPTDGNNTLYGTGYETGLVGVPISEGVYTRDIKPLSTGEGEIDTLIGGTAEDTFFLGNASLLNDKAQAFYVGGGDSDYALIKNLDSETAIGFPYLDEGIEYPGEELTDRVALAGQPYDYSYEKVDGTTRISTKDGDLIAIIEEEVTLDAPWAPIPGGFYLYPTDVPTARIITEFTKPYFNESFYLTQYPEVAEAIANGEYESGYEHYVKVGQFDGEVEMILSGTAGDDGVEGFSGMGLGASELMFGVPLTSVDGEKEGWISETTGVGERDYLKGGMGATTFFIGNDQILDPTKPIDVYYVGEGDEDFAEITSFDPYKDFIFAAGNFEDYMIESVEETVDEFGRKATIRNLEISYQGDLVAKVVNLDNSLTLEGGWTLQEFDFGDERPNAFAFVAPVNEALPPEPPAGSEYWNEAFYLAVFPEVAELVAKGEYESALDYYIKVGQFLTPEDGGEKEGYFTGTKGNDIIKGFGVDNDLHGTEIADVTYDADTTTVSVTLGSTGEGEIDVLVGTDEVNGFYAGGAWTKYNTTDFTGESIPYYRGQGDNDYSLVKGYQPDKDYVYFAGNAADYNYVSVDGNFKIYTEDGDLITIIEGVSDLIANNLDSLGGFYFTGAMMEGHDGGEPEMMGFDEDLYLQFTPDAAKAVADGLFASGLDYYVAVGQYALDETGEPASEGFFTGNSGDNTIIGFGLATGLTGIGLKSRTDIDPFAIEFESTGEGEVDTLVGNSGKNGFLLGSFVTPASPEQFVFYQGKGDRDYALIQNFNPGEVGGDELEMVGNPDDYTYETVDGDTKIIYKGDLVAIVENITDLQVTSTFVEGEASYFTLGKYPVEYFNPDVYAAFNPDIFEFIGEGKPYKDVLDYYIQEGQFREDGGGHGFFSGTSGNDVIQGFGFDKDLFGVKVQSVSGTANDIVTIVPETLGVGEIDTYIGAPGVDGFWAAIFTEVDFNNFVGDAAQLYLGEGDSDYVLIKDFDPTKDYLALAGSPEDFIYKVESNDFKVYSQEGDLVAIVKDTTDLKIENENILETFNVFTFTGDTKGQELGFDEEAYLGIYPEVTELIAKGQFSSALEHYIQIGQYEEGGGIYSGTSGDDTVISWTQNAEVRLSGVDYIKAEPAGFEEGQNYFGIKPASYGVGEIDTLILSPDEGTIGEALLGFFRAADGSIQRFYVGEGDNDYALVKNFNKNDIDEIFLAGIPEEYTYEDVDGNLNIAYQGDLVGIVEGVKFEELELADEGEGSGAFVLIGIPEGTEPTPEDYFNERVYLTLHPKVEELIDAGEYESAYEYYLEVGQDKGHRAFLSGTPNGNDNITAIGDKSTLLGVEVTGYDKENNQFITAGDGAGEIDSLTGNEGRNRFFVGNNGESFYIGNGDEDYASIKNFDPTQDRVILGGEAEDYTYETIDGNFQIAKDGDLVAIVEGISDLKPFKGYTLEGRTQLLSLENDFFAKFVEPYFFAPAYPVQNPDVDELIAAGEYTSYYDHFLKAGQFEQREDTFLAATEGNDTLYAVGWETILSGVPISAAQYENGLDVVPTNLGSGQIDTLYSDAGAGKETIFMLGNTNLLNDTPQSFYLGNGDADYALIKHFSPGDRIFLGSDIAAFTQTAVDGNLHIAKDGDLIAIIENRTELVSDRDNELTSLVVESYASGTDGDDIVFGSNRQSNIIGVPLANSETNTAYATTTGVGEFDILNGSKRGDNFYLGITTTPDGSAQPLYVGGGDTDYALISDFSNTDIYDSVVLAGKVSDYKFEFEAYEGTGNDTKIYTKDGDLISIVKNATLSQFYVDGNPEGIDIALFSVSTSGTTAEVADYLFDIEPFFYEDFYLDENPEVSDLIASGEYGSAFEHFIEVGQFSPDSEVILTGTEGDDFIPSMGKTDLLFGVPLITVDGKLEGWEEASTGVGEKDTLSGGLGVTTFVIGNDQILNPDQPNEVYYVGEGDEDYALIQGFQPTQDFIFGAGSIDEYNFATVDGDLKISYGSDLVAIVQDVDDLILQELPLGDERPRGLALVAPENQFLQGMD